MKKVLPPVVFAVLLLIGVGMMVRPDVVGSWVSVGTPQQAVIVRETSVSQPLSIELTELYAKAPSLGVAVWDKDVVGKGKQPSAVAKPFLDAWIASELELPVIVLRWSGGGLTVKPCPVTLDGLKKEVGK